MQADNIHGTLKRLWIKESSKPPWVRGLIRCAYQIRFNVASVIACALTLEPQPQYLAPAGYLPRLFLITAATLADEWKAFLYAGGEPPTGSGYESSLGIAATLQQSLFLFRGHRRPSCL